MNLQEKLKIIQKVSGLNQTQLATKIGVSYVAFNNWWLEKAKPHKSKELIIDNLYKELTGQKIIPDSILLAKKELLLKKSKKFSNILHYIYFNPDIFNQSLLSLTYNSNKIEGSSLTENETADIMFNDKALANKSLIEHLEVKNHQSALKYLFRYLLTQKSISKDLILKLHSILLNGIREDAGFFRNHGVRILGSNVPTSNYLKVPELISELIKEMNKKPKDIIALSTITHARFEQIHPFADGNGRIGRMIMQAMLINSNIAPAIILQNFKQEYYACLSAAQLKNEFSQLENFICDAVLHSFNILER